MTTIALTEATARDLGARLGKVLADRLGPLEADVEALRAEVARLRALTEPGKTITRRRDAQGVAHTFKEVVADPSDPGSAKLMLEDGSYVRVGREAAAKWHDAVAGRA
jgi:hypothetical protein